MRRNVNNAKLTKSFILEKVSQISIFAAYTNLDIGVIQNCIDTGNFINSPFRIDNHPSFGFTYDNRNKLKGRDFAGFFWGDCFDAVAFVLSPIVGRNININNKDEFVFVLKHIAYTFRDIIYGKEKDENTIVTINNGLNAVRNRKNIIEIVNRSWNEDDRKYWNTFGISLNLLNTHYVYPVDQYYVNRYANPEPKYYYSKKDPCYAYILGQDRNGIYNVKLYFPKRSKREARFITNCNHIEGVLNFDNPNLYDIVVITKSTKDRLAIESYLHCSNNPTLYGGTQQTKLNIGIINIPAEHYNLKQREYDYIRNKLHPNGTIISLMDNDRTGYMEAIKLRDSYNITPIIIPKEYEAKDFAELRSLYSIETIDKLVNNVINYIREENEEYKLVWDKETSDSLPY